MRVGLLGATLLDIPFRAPVPPGCSRRCPPAQARSFPPLSSPSVGGGGRGWFPSSLPHLLAPPRQKSAPPLLADGLSSCDSVLAWGGRVAGDSKRQPISPTRPGRLPQVKGACLCVAGMPSSILSAEVSEPRVVPTLNLFCQLTGSWSSSRLG